MDEYDRGMDPEMRRYFKKIATSFTVGLLWMMTFAVSGIFFGLGIVDKDLRWHHLVFYAVFIASFFLLLRFLHKIWKG